MKFSTNEKILLFVSGLGLISLIILKLFLPKEDNWDFNYRSNSTDPYGCKATFTLIKPLFGNVLTNSKPFSQFIRANASDTLSYVIITSNYSPTQYETKQLLNWVYKGNKVLISASYFGNSILDTLKLYATRPSFKTSQNISFLNHKRRIDSHTFSYPNLFPTTSFKTDSVSNIEKIAECDSLALALTLKFGKGEIILDAAPFLHTNYIVLHTSSVYSERIFNRIRSKKLIWDERYKPGNIAQGSMITFILNRPSLEGAYFTLLIGVLLSFYFGFRRKERIIPILSQPKNTSVELATAIGLLWYNQKNYKSIAISKWHFFKERVYEKTRIRWDTNQFKEISTRLGVDHPQLVKINNFSMEIEKAENISVDKLYTFYKELKEILK